MPFESFLNKSKSKRGMAFHATVVLSIGLHAGALAWATVHSMTQVDELAPPSVKLSFLHAPVLAAPPKPLKPETAGGAAAAAASAPKTHQAHRPVVRRRPDAVLPPVAAPLVAAPQAPQREPKAEPAEAPVAAAPPAAGAVTTAPTAGEQGAGSPAGRMGGTGAGTGSGQGNATGAGPGLPSGGGAPRFLPEALGKAQRLSGAAPAFPAQLAKQQAQFLVMAKVCVDRAGAVESVDLMKRADPSLDQNVIEAVKRWRYRPLLAGQSAVPFCTFVRFEFRAE